MIKNQNRSQPLYVREFTTKTWVALPPPCRMQTSTPLLQLPAPVRGKLGRCMRCWRNWRVWPWTSWKGSGVVMVTSGQQWFFLYVGGFVSRNKSWSWLVLPHDVAVSTCMSNNWVTKSLLLSGFKISLMGFLELKALKQIALSTMASCAEAKSALEFLMTADRCSGTAACPCSSSFDVWKQAKC